ncbi:MAG: hypothetical protein JNK05_02060 [Myxococcales bacterium]|nr:hypothetical protein [Myxococcales bacterium]
MTYREDREAIEQNLAGLRATLDALRTTDLDPVTLEARTVALETEICRLQARLRNEPPAPPLLRRLKVLSPCEQPWDRMRGTNAIRHCESCDKDVYNLEQMTMPEVEAMVVATGGRPCVRLLLRADGLIVTSECLRAEQDRRLKRHGRAAAVAVVAAILAGSALVAWKRFGSSVRSTGAAPCSNEITEL